MQVTVLVENASFNTIGPLRTMVPLPVLTSRIGSRFVELNDPSGRGR
jgi:hypothetical protein